MTKHFKSYQFYPDNYFSPLDITTIFPQQQPLEVDLGSGDGSFAVAMAQKYPNHNFLAVERLLGRVEKTCKKAQQYNLTNLRVLRLESKYTLEWLIPHNTVHRLHILFADPWPKKRHHNRRIIQPQFLEIVQQKLTNNGLCVIKTDDLPYYQWMLETLAQAQLTHLIDSTEQLQSSTLPYPETDFEQHWKSLGKSIYMLQLTKTATTNTVL